MSTIPEKLDHLIDLMEGPPLFPGWEFASTEDGPLLKSGGYRSQLLLPTRNAAWQYMQLDVVAFDAVSFKLWFIAPDGRHSREFFFQLGTVKNSQ